MKVYGDHNVEESTIHALKFEYVEGQTLHQLIQDKKILDERFILHILFQIMKVVSYAHLKGYAIMNLSLHNIHFDKDFNIKIFDLSEIVSLKKGVRKGKLGPSENYPPEMLKAEPRFHPKQVDIFHAGILFFEMLTMGVKPFHKAATADDTVYKYIQLDRCDLFYAILVHESLYKNHKNLSKGVKTLLSFMIAYLGHERLSADEVLAYIKDINVQNKYDVTNADQHQQLQWRLDHVNQTSNFQPLDFGAKIRLQNILEEKEDQKPVQENEQNKAPQFGSSLKKSSKRISKYRGSSNLNSK